MRPVTTVAKIPMEQLQEYREWVESHGGEVLLPRKLAEKKEAEPEKEIKRGRNGKPEAIYKGFSNHDCEAHYKCPICGTNFGSWSVDRNEKRCPHCGEELDGLD